MQISKVMIVDDDPVIRRIAEISLTTVANWKVVLAASGAEALKLVPDARPDLILLDMTMPGMDGPATLNKLREAFGRIPVIFMTAREKDEMAAHLSDNVDGIICKPFDPIELPIQISAILRVTGAGAV